VSETSTFFQGLVSYETVMPQCIRRMTKANKYILVYSLSTAGVGGMKKEDRPHSEA